MPINNLKITDSPTKEQWEYIMDNSASAHVYQSWVWSELYSKKQGIRSIKLLAVWDGQPVGALLCFEHKSFFNHSFFSGGSGAGGGPVIIDELVDAQKAEIYECLIVEAYHFSQKNCCTSFLLYTYPGDNNNLSIFQVNKGIKHTPIITLTGDKKFFYEKHVSKKSRNQILKSFKIGVTTELGGRENLRDYLGLQNDLIARKNLDEDAINSQQDLYDLWDTLYPLGVIKLYLARYEGLIIGGAIILFFKKSLFYKSGAMDEKGYQLSAMNAIQWRVISDAIDAGFLNYNLVGGTADQSSANYGISHFKMGLGAKLAQFYRYSAVKRGMRARLVTILKLLFKIKNLPPLITYP